jgi:hypothetical protein
MSNHISLHVGRADPPPIAALGTLTLLALAAAFAFTAPGSSATASAARTHAAGHPAPVITTTAGTTGHTFASVRVPAEPAH